MTIPTPPEGQPSTWVPPSDPTDPLQQDVTRILKSFKLDILGIIHLGKDGILRSLTADRKVLSAEALNSEQIKAYMERVPASLAMIEVQEADGTKTAKEKWFEPDGGILPEPLSQELIDSARNMSEEDKDQLRASMKDDERVVDASGVLG